MKNILSFLLIATVFIGCKKDTDNNTTNPPTGTDLSKIENTKGYSLLNKVKGIWNGPVTSTTPLGGYSEWIVDFRPISESGVAAKNELDSLNDIHMSFFITKYNNEYRVAFRNGGSFSGMHRVSYFLCDSVSETSSQSYYRFAEALKGWHRAYTEIVFKSDSLIMRTYTNKNNTLAIPVAHMTWSAKLQDSTSCQAAVTHFAFPQKVLAKDFSTLFAGQTEAVYYDLVSDPYPEAAQPYLGQATINYSYASGYNADANKKTFLIITTQPLINGFSFNTGNLIFRSRYVVLPANDLNFTFNYMHPGTYYLYAIYDADGSNSFSSGDWVSTNNATFSFGDKGTVSASTVINFMVP